jgi:hypothetical protein
MSARDISVWDIVYNAIEPIKKRYGLTSISHGYGDPAFMDEVLVVFTSLRLVDGLTDAQLSKAYPNTYALVRSRMAEKEANRDGERD